MSYVIAAPERMTSAASDLATIGSDLSAAHTAAALPTAAVIPAAADEVSAGIAHMFSRYAGGFQALAGQAAAFHQQFVQQLRTSAGSYNGIEAANAGLLRPLNARAGSSPSAIAALSGPSLNSVLTSINALLGQLLNRLEIIWNYEFLQTLRNLPSDILLTVLVLILNVQILFGLLPPGTTLF
jgi:hypothetical protein